MRKTVFRIVVFMAWAGVLTAGERPNILLLTVDSFRPDRLGCSGYRHARTPSIDRLAAGGVLFTRAFSTASWTNPSLVSMLTGLYPGVHGVERRGRSVPGALDTPMEAMARAGMMVPEINYLFPMPNYTGLGFTPNEFRDLPGFLAAYRDSTFFAWYHFHGPHLPYHPPERCLELFGLDSLEGSRSLAAVMENVLMPRGEYIFTPREQALVSALYDAEVAAQDEEIGRVLEALDSLGLTGKTIVVLSADHGEELFDHGWLGHASTSLSGTLFDELIRIPLIISWPARLPAGRVVARPVQSVDLMPTLFELAGLVWQGPGQGESLLPVIEDRGPGPGEVVFCETSICGYQCEDGLEPVWLRCVRTDRFKLVQTLAPGGEPSYSLYDLEADPGEREDCASRLPEEVIRLQGMLHARVFAGRRLRMSLLAADSAGTAAHGSGAPGPEAPCEVTSPREGETVAFGSYQGRVPVSWAGPEDSEYVVEYRVGRGKYHLEGSFPVRGSGETFGPFNRIFWQALPLYNPWSFRVVPRDRPELTGSWRTFNFE
ncbi:MAG: sulfatase [Candidatus Glassbacteria bacterium]|nr:sulfatase [Candidatus Glassbacteria bacterium]